jgi:TonB family protein
MTPVNAVAACAQIALLVALCAGLPRLLRLRAPSVQYLFWRVLLTTCLLLPLLAPRLPAEMAFVPAPTGLLSQASGAAGAPLGPPVPAAARIDWWRVGAIVIVTGIVVRLAWIALGIFRLHRMRTRAREEAAGFDDLAQAIGVTAPILWSGDVSHPVTFGAWRPVVLLPMALKSVDVLARRAVVAHELHHVKRRDWLWVLGEEVVRSLLWFHPAVWWLISRVQLARETVVDELSILTTNARRAYLDTLLAFADDTGLSPAFSARRHLFHRVMLLSKEGGMSSIRIVASSCVLAVALAAGSWSAVYAFPLHAAWQQPPPPPPPPPRDPLSPAAYHRLAVQYLEKVFGDTSLADDQKLEAILKGIAAEDRALELNVEYVDAIVFKSVLLRMQANLTSDTTERDRLLAQANELRMKAIALRPPPPPPPPPPLPRAGRDEMVFVPAPSTPAEFERHTSPPNAIRVGAGIKQPTKIRDVKPVYPPIAQQAGVSGVVIVEVVIDTDGNVAEGRILRSIPLLDQAALDAVKQWRFVPTQLNGTTVPVIMTVAVNFSPQ